MTQEPARSSSAAAPRLATVFGGSGFLGRFVVAELARRGYRVRVAVRRPDLAWYLSPLGAVGQIRAVQANLRYPESVAHAAKGADVVVNLTGILKERGKQTFDAVHVQGVKAIVEAAEPGAALVHISALGIDDNDEARYAVSKREGEKTLLAARPDAIILRPSVIFGEGDAFFNRLAWLIRLSPVLPVPALDALLQPVYGGDVALAVLAALDGKAKPGAVYELGGPEINTMRDLFNYVAKITFRKRTFLKCPDWAARFNAKMSDLTDRLTFGLMPEELVMTPDQLSLLKHHSIVSRRALDEGRTFAALGIVPQGYQAIVPEYLARFRRAGQFEEERRREGVLQQS